MVDFSKEISRIKYYVTSFHYFIVLTFFFLMVLLLYFLDISIFNIHYSSISYSLSYSLPRFYVL